MKPLSFAVQATPGKRLFRLLAQSPAQLVLRCLNATKPGFHIHQEHLELVATDASSVPYQELSLVPGGEATLNQEQALLELRCVSGSGLIECDGSIEERDDVRWLIEPGPLSRPDLGDYKFLNSSSSSQSGAESNSSLSSASSQSSSSSPSSASSASPASSASSASSSSSSTSESSSSSLSGETPQGIYLVQVIDGNSATADLSSLTVLPGDLLTLFSYARDSGGAPAAVIPDGFMLFAHEYSDETKARCFIGASLVGAGEVPVLTGDSGNHWGALLFRSTYGPLSCPNWHGYAEFSDEELYPHDMQLPEYPFWPKLVLVHAGSTGSPVNVFADAPPPNVIGVHPAVDAPGGDYNISWANTEETEHWKQVNLDGDLGDSNFRQSGFAYFVDPVPVQDGLQLWLDGNDRFQMFNAEEGGGLVQAENEPVVRLEDKSGNGNHALRLAPGLEPWLQLNSIGSVSAVNFALVGGSGYIVPSLTLPTSKTIVLAGALPVFEDGADWVVYQHGASFLSGGNGSLLTARGWSHCHGEVTHSAWAGANVAGHTGLVIFTYDGSDGTGHMYVNGNEVSLTPSGFADVSDYDFTAPMRIGIDFAGGGYAGFNMNTFLAYDRVLTSGELAQLTDHFEKHFHAFDTWPPEEDP